MAGGQRVFGKSWVEKAGGSDGKPLEGTFVVADGGSDKICSCNHCEELRTSTRKKKW